MKFSKKLSALLLASVMVVGMAACTAKPAPAPAPSAPPAPTGEPTAAPVAGPLDISVCIASEPQSIDPALNSALDGGTMIQHMFEGLTKWVDSGVPIDAKINGVELVAGQAESWTKNANDDGTVTYTFTLRDGIQWSDGKPVTANDFLYSWQRLVAPTTASDYSNMLDPVVNAYEVRNGEKDPAELGVKAIDDKTLEVTIVNDIPYFLELCAFPSLYPVRQDIIEAHGDQWTFDPATYISNGAYKMQQWEHNAQIVMVPNETYYDKASQGPATITFKLMDNNNAMLSGFNSGELDFVNDLPVDEIAALLTSGELNIVDYTGIYYACFQTQKAPFDNPLVREAFTLAVDRTYIVDKVTQTGQVEAGGYVPEAIYEADGTTSFRDVGGNYYAPTDADYAANCEKARALLAEAGYPGGEGFPVVEYLYNTSDAHKAVGEALQNMWQTELGVQVTLNNQEWAVFLQTRKDGNYSIARNGWIADYNDPMSFLDMWLTGGGNNDAQYANPDYDALINKARNTSDPVERTKLLHQAEDIIIGQDKALCPLYFYTEKYMLKDTIAGVHYTPLGFFFFNTATTR